jgi:hypothetical protein
MPPVKKATASKPVKDAIDQTVIYADKNLYFEGYGHIDKGYSVIKKENLEVFLQSKAVREVSAVELARHYGKAQ